jgi:hypothetical protein
LLVEEKWEPDGKVLSLAKNRTFIGLCLFVPQHFAKLRWALRMFTIKIEVAAGRVIGLRVGNCALRSRNEDAIGGHGVQAG